MKFENILLLLISISFIISCKKNEEIIEPCKVNIEDEAYMLNEESLIFFPYKEEQNIIFKDSMNNEILFNQIAYSVEDTEFGQFRNPCKMSSEEFLFYRYNGKSVKYNCEEIDLDIWVSLDVGVTEFGNLNCSDCGYDLNTFDILNIILGDGDYDNLSIRVDNDITIITSNSINDFRIPDRIANQNITFYDKITLLNNIFSNVKFRKKSVNSSGRVEEMYLNESGELIAFTDQKDNLWVFDRYE